MLKLVKTITDFYVTYSKVPRLSQKDD
jgi:hypothetical protein